MPKHQFDVSVTPQYMPEHSAPEAGVYQFAYTITIRNSGATAAQLIARHWIIKDASGKVQEVRGLGVVGHQPLLQPGESFQYQSQCRLATPQGSMEGTYFCITEDADTFDCPIPRFVLDATQYPEQDDDLAHGRVLH
ncbi:ApaG protein [Comamonas odontotermitis]|uniref:Protein ApaG n=1 Tax=Comamonas odontotermitis TaxID=379895 RepID=A0ABR6RBW9_9BURK|nr:Co2+/Mg2+ efflux protein ApaG [Comamonas odontotermitis]MBB6576662.1 ApaG protein [Comamonas odontotermitis]